MLEQLRRKAGDWIIQPAPNKNKDSWNVQLFNTFTNEKLAIEYFYNENNKEEQFRQFTKYIKMITLEENILKPYIITNLEELKEWMRPKDTLFINIYDDTYVIQDYNHYKKQFEMWSWDALREEYNTIIKIPNFYYYKQESQIAVADEMKYKEGYYCEICHEPLSQTTFEENHELCDDCKEGVMRENYPNEHPEAFMPTQELEV